VSTEQDYGYQEFMDSVDTLVIGRNTFVPYRACVQPYTAPFSCVWAVNCER
jgi:hypothetical protein